MAESNFVDYVKINCRSGKGGKGSMHLRHVKYQPNGGPDGGDGGHHHIEGLGTVDEIFARVCNVIDKL